ncbi:MAG TPA: ABC transporter ATP-binding protein/permease [Candidatus Tetragenococcus pullicola]|nr:ABC transporter ATP-binding protein/permease [Candidatus Tetragenococcus pullicola]
MAKKSVPGQPKQLNTNMLKRLISYVFNLYPKRIIIVFFAILISSFAQVGSSLFMKTLIDNYITPLLETSNPNFAPLMRALLMMASIYLIGVLANFTYQKLLITISQGSMEAIRMDLFSHMEKLPIRYFDTHSHGDMMSIYTNDIDTFRQVISQSIPQFVNSFITICMVFISMITVSIPLTLLTVFMVFIMQIVLRKIMGKSSKYFSQQQQQLGVENGYIEEIMEGAKVVKVFNHENHAINDFVTINDELFDDSYQANKYANILMPIVGNIGNISYVLCAIFGGILALNGYTGLTIGSLASFLALNKSFTGPLNQISQQLNSVIMAMAGAKRIFKLLDEEIEDDQGRVTLVNVIEHEDGSLEEKEEVTHLWAWKHEHSDGSIEFVKLTGDVHFNDVTFGYNPEKTVLKDINLHAKSGQKVAFVGATGAGKTTITNLINRFYDINNGSIIYDGIDIKLIKKPDLRRSLGTVLQETNLFSGTVAQNIRYARPDASMEEVEEAAKLANAHTFIEHLENGYDTQLTRNGSSLSEGQRQLLSIARAALANPPVLILDEATSSIDSSTEQLVQEGMDKLMAGRTTFVIAHRLSTIKNSDNIMVLDHGEIIERGDHDSLMKQKGMYYQLYTGVIEID